MNRRRSRILVGSTPGLTGLFFCVWFAAIPVHASHPPDFSDKVLRVEVAHKDGSVEIASAVPISKGVLVTNCHALREANTVQVFGKGRAWRAELAKGDTYRDLCFLDVPGLSTPPIAMAEEREMRVGMTSYAVGYTHGELAVDEGVVKGLHTCPCDGGRVIQTSASFDRGASGGGLFDQRGRLVGILTFKSGMGGDFHFAIPVAWLRTLARENAEPLQAGKTFWEQSGKGSLYFLTACALGAKQNWRPLAELSGDWTVNEPDNPEAWMALGRANAGLGRSESAAMAFQRALALDSNYEEATLELQRLEFDMDQDLLRTGQH